MRFDQRQRLLQCFGYRNGFPADRFVAGEPFHVSDDLAHSPRQIVDELQVAREIGRTAEAAMRTALLDNVMIAASG